MTRPGIVLVRYSSSNTREARDRLLDPPGLGTEREQVVAASLSSRSYGYWPAGEIRGRSCLGIESRSGRREPCERECTGELAGVPQGLAAQVTSLGGTTPIRLRTGSTI